ncbi:unnamed protein product [Protopolystoma xenopodis]|uniref:Uncharacterized protein n=1 Tax=Protopolystoma xenopodis TaxID=117903 RepID=A0A448X7G1_9PLAT|nr:unnamed protein product [Protopolystoma xenopodis]
MLPFVRPYTPCSFVIVSSLTSCAHFGRQEGARSEINTRLLVQKRLTLWSGGQSDDLATTTPLCGSRCGHTVSPLQLYRRPDGLYSRDLSASIGRPGYMLAPQEKLKQAQVWLKAEVGRRSVNWSHFVCLAFPDEVMTALVIGFHR